MSDGLKDSFKNCQVIANNSASNTFIVDSSEGGPVSNEPIVNTYEFRGINGPILTEGTKFDNDKPVLALVPASLEEAVGEILTMGAKKYAPHNWKKGIKYSRIVSSLKRHLNEFYKGNLIDKESNKPHIWHVACNIAFLIEYESNPAKYKEFNDLYEGDPK